MGARDKTFGTILSLLAILLGLVFAYAVWWPGGFALLAIQTVVSLLVLFTIGVIFWVGYTIATTPSIEEVEKAAKA